MCQIYDNILALLKTIQHYNRLPKHENSNLENKIKRTFTVTFLQIIYNAYKNEDIKKNLADETETLVI